MGVPLPTLPTQPISVYQSNLGQQPSVMSAASMPSIVNPGPVSIVNPGPVSIVNPGPVVNSGPVMVNSGVAGGGGAVVTNCVGLGLATNSTPNGPKMVNSHVSPPRQFTSESQVLDKKRLGELVKEVDPTEQLDEDVEDVLLTIADDFIEQTVSQACALARHRKATTIDVKDVQLVLERNWNMWIPGFGTEEIRPYKRSVTAEAHKQRLALIRKTLKKY